MRTHFGIALLAVLCLLAFNLPQASAGRRYKRVCDLVGCKRCYTPSKTCFGRICQEMYACEEDKCGDGFIYNEASGMCDCKEGFGIVLGRCSYKRYWRTPGFSAYYPGMYGYNKLAFKFYRPRGRGYGPTSYGYRPSYYVGGPYCQRCPLGFNSAGGEPLHTFCMPETRLGTIKLLTQPSGAAVSFNVELAFNVPGGCAGPLKKAAIQMLSTPADVITCDPAKVDGECRATTACKASRLGTFKLSAKLKGVDGVVTDQVEVVVPAVQPGVTTTTVVTIEAIYTALTDAQKQGLNQAAEEAATGLTAELATTNAGVTVTVSSIAAGSIKITFAVNGNPTQVAAALPIIRTGWPKFLATLVSKLQLLTLLNSSGHLVRAADFEAVILVNGNADTQGPIVPNTPPTDKEVMIIVDAVADVNTATTVVLDPDEMSYLGNSIKDTAEALVTSLTELNGAAIKRVQVAPGAKTHVEVWIICPEKIAPTVFDTIAIEGNQNIIRKATWQMVDKLIKWKYPDMDLGEFAIAITATLQPEPNR